MLKEEEKIITKSDVVIKQRMFPYEDLLHRFFKTGKMFRPAFHAVTNLSTSTHQKGASSDPCLVSGFSMEVSPSRCTD